MDDFSDYETAQYHKADPISNTVSDYVYCTIDVLWFSLKVFIFAGFELLKNAFYWLFNKSEPKSISGQLALITGSANGLGREIAIKLASDGCNVAIVDLDLLNAKRTVQTITGLFDVKCKAFKCDVSKFEDVQNLKDEVEKSFGTSVDILVNNAGLLPHMSLETVTPNDIQKIINVNLMSQIWTVKTFVGEMINQKRGHIVAICSMAAKTTYPFGQIYCASKFGVDGFMKAFFDELLVNDQDKFIHLSTVYPMLINTRKELIDKANESKLRFLAMTPEYVAEQVVKNVKNNKKSIFIPWFACAAAAYNCLPRNTIKLVKGTVIPS